MKGTEMQRQLEEHVALERRLAQAEKFAMIGRLSGGLAHELGAPLSVISLHVHRIREASADDSAVRREAEAIQAEVERMSTFLQGLLHLSRRQGVVFRRVDLQQVVERVERESKAHAAAADASLELHRRARPVMVRGHEAMICHALQNVVRNAIQALEDSDGVREVHVRLEATRSEAVLIVEDTGPGIPVEQLPYLFEPFHTTKEATDGMGLGLAVSLGILEEHGGDMTIANRASRGVRVVIRLPLEPDPPAERAT